MRSGFSVGKIGKNRRRSMKGIRSRPVLLVGLVLAMVLGFAIYFRLWTIDYSISSAETEMLRKEFDLAHREAMDEAAEWRRQYDWELQRASTCERELEEARKKESSADIKMKMAALQKENEALLKKLELLKNELDTEKSRCRSKELQ